MAVTKKVTGTENPMKQQQAQPNQQTQQTVQAPVYQPPQQQTYTPSQSVQQAQTAMQQQAAAKPQGYTSKYGGQLDSILQQIQNPKDFKYSFDGDELFKYYADLYTQKGKQASADAMGQAAALTGGYGNSYAQQVGNQAYDQYLLNLYDKGMDLRDRAYQQYQDQRADLYNQLGALGDADERDYNRYRDTVSDWEKERDYLTGRYDTERGFDYDMYTDTRDFGEKQRQYDLDYAQKQAQIDFDQQMEQQKFDEDVRRYGLDYAQKQQQIDWQQGFDQKQFDEDVRRYGLDYAQKQQQIDQDEAYRQQQFEEDVRRYGLDYAQKQQQIDWDQAMEQQKYDEMVREYGLDYAQKQQQIDLDEAYRQKQFDEDVRRYDQDYQMQQEELQEKIRQFDESLDWDKLSSQQKYAAQYAMMMLERGQMPSAELLELIGLSEADARKILTPVGPTSVSVRVSTTGPQTQSQKPTGSDLQGMSYEDASRLVLQQTPLDYKLPGKDGVTLGDYQKKLDQQAEQKTQQQAEQLKTSPQSFSQVQSGIGQQKLGIGGLAAVTQSLEKLRRK